MGQDIENKLIDKVNQLNKERWEKGLPIVTAVEGRDDQFIEHHKYGPKVLRTIDDDLNVTRRRKDQF